MGTDCSALQGYSSIYNNRKLIHKNACSGSGGVVFLISNDVKQRYHITREDVGEDDILAINLVDKDTQYKITMIGVYIPPETSTHAEDVDVFFQKLVCMLYEVYDSDMCPNLWRL